MRDADVIIIGSGPAGAQAAQAAAEQGATVILIDIGRRAPAILNASPSIGFDDLRRTREDQWKLFLGEDVSSIPVEGMQGGLGGGMASGNRSYVTAGSDVLLPLKVTNAHVLQAVGEGGLGALWGAASAYMGEAELRAMGLPVAEMERAYDDVTTHIGVSGPGSRTGIQSPLPPDHHAAAIMERAARKSEALKAQDIRVTPPYLAALSRDLGDRHASRGDEMEYYADPGKSVYRPQYTIETLEKLPNVRIMRDLKVERIQETADGVDVHCTSLERNAAEVIGAKTVLVAAGAIGTARILLRSLGLFDIDIPFVSKPHAFSALLHSTMLGKIGTTKTHALCQLLLIDEHRTAEGLCSGVAQLYSYKTLLLFRLLGSLPLPAPQALRVAAALAPALMVADIRFPGLPGVGRTLRLQRTGETDRLELAMDDSAAEQAAESASHRRLKKAMKTLGLLPIRNMRLPHASASHHAGTVAVGNTEAPLSCDSSGLVTGLRRTYVADASMFRLLPPQPHTLTLMANARRVAGCALEAL